jgi:2-amino-4-hydroxy-6-hydroxymethyldihydropteridine diphosphokinase
VNISSNPIVYLGIGSNLGDRLKNIQNAIALLSTLPKVKILRQSSVIETKPVGGPKQEDYLNSVVAIETALTPIGLLNRLQRIEKDMGRVRAVRWGPRTIDLDILLWGDKIIRTKRLTVPHKHMHERDFVMGPLVEIYASNLKNFSVKKNHRCRTKK